MRSNIDISSQLLQAIDPIDLFPRAAAHKESEINFRWDFGLDSLPTEEGVILIRGPRQYGKSTWLETMILETYKEYGPGSCAYINGDLVADSNSLRDELLLVANSLRKDALVRRVFIDEITAIEDWQRAIKVLVDTNDLKGVLVVTTGSKASDLRRGGERLPGRKGKLARTHYTFVPISYKEFLRVCGDRIEPHLRTSSYIISGGSPIAAKELILRQEIPEYVFEITRDWIFGEIALAGRQRSVVIAIIEQIFRSASSPLGYTKLAREAGLANNTEALNYMELLQDLHVAAPCFAWDTVRNNAIRRKPCKFHFINLLAAGSFSPFRTRSAAAFANLPQNIRAPYWEWMVAQEIFRRQAIKGSELPELLGYWSGPSSEVDFVINTEQALEVKMGQASPYEFREFESHNPRYQLKVICSNTLHTERIKSLSLEDFLVN